VVGPRFVQCSPGRGICAGNPILPLDQFSRTGTNPERGRGSIEARGSSPEHHYNSLRPQDSK